MSEGHKFFIGRDVALSAGEDAIKEFIDIEGEQNELFFDIDEVKRRNLEGEPTLREFLRYAQRGKRQDDGSFLISSGGNKLKVHLKAPDKKDRSSIEGVTDDPFIRQNFYDSDILEVNRPRFLIRDPSILEKGIIKSRIDSRRSSLEDRFSLDKASQIIEDFDDSLSFINQFWLLDCEDGTQALYQIKQDWDLKENDDPDIKAEPELVRIEKDSTFFSSNKNDLNESFYGITTNHLHQYLAMKYLLLDPKIQFVVLSGDAGTGKTLLPYLAGLHQTLVESPESIKDRKGLEKVIRELRNQGESIYDCMRLMKPSLPPQEYYTGFKPGDIDDKLHGLMRSFRHIHDTEIPDLPRNLRYDDARIIQQPNKFRDQNLYFPSANHPLIMEEAIEDLKGMTYRNSFIVADEVEDASRRIAKAMLTRVGKGSKMVFCGDPKQIDNPKLREDTNGLVYAAHGHATSGLPFFGMMHLEKSDRSPIANFSNRLPNWRD